MDPPQEELCRALWRLVLAQRCLERLKAVAGAKMLVLLEAVNTEIYFVTSCAFQVSPAGCVGRREWIPSCSLGAGDQADPAPPGDAQGSLGGLEQDHPASRSPGRWMVSISGPCWAWPAGKEGWLLRS